MQSPTTGTCEYCAKRPADQTLFTTFMRCGEGDATKRNARLCDRCRHHAMLVLDHVGMTVAFEGDGQLDWDAHVTLAESATRSRARRAVQREDLLVQLGNASAANRAPAATQPEKLSILHGLAAEGLVENAIERSEFWPEGHLQADRKGRRGGPLHPRTAPGRGRRASDRGVEPAVRSRAGNRRGVPRIRRPARDLAGRRPLRRRPAPDAPPRRRRTGRRDRQRTADTPVLRRGDVDDPAGAADGLLLLREHPRHRVRRRRRADPRRVLRAHPGGRRTRRPVDDHGPGAREPHAPGRSRTRSNQGRRSRKHADRVRLHLPAPGESGQGSSCCGNGRASRATPTRTPASADHATTPLGHRRGSGRAPRGGTADRR